MAGRSVLFIDVISEFERLAKNSDTGLDRKIRSYVAGAVKDVDIQLRRDFVKSLKSVVDQKICNLMLSSFIDEVGKWPEEPQMEILEAIPAYMCSKEEVGNVKNAESLLKKTIVFRTRNVGVDKNLFKEVKACEARVADMRLKFLEACNLYLDAFDIDESNNSFSHAVKCAILAIESEPREKMMSFLIQKPICKKLEYFSVLMKIFLKKMLTEEDLALFYGELEIHQQSYFDRNLRNKVPFLVEKKAEKEVEIEAKTVLTDAELETMLMYEHCKYVDSFSLNTVEK